MSFIDEHREEHGVEPICRKLPIAPSTYYEQKAREADPSRLSARSVREVEFREEIERAWRGFLGRAGGHGVADSDDESVPKTGQNRRTSRPHLALRGTTWHKSAPYMYAYMRVRRTSGIATSCHPAQLPREDRARPPGRRATVAARGR